MKNIFFYSLISATVILTGCASKFKSTVNFNPTQPLRIAVLPFVQVDKKGSIVEVDSSYLIDKVSLISSQLPETPAKFVQNAAQAELTKASLDILTPAYVEADLVHGGFDLAGADPVKVDLAKLYSTSATTLCNQLLACDAVLFGKITEWSRSYYGIQAVVTVGIDLKLVSAKDQKVLFESSAIDSDSRGLSKGPTGYSSIVLEPLKGLDNELISALAQEVVEKSLAPLFVKNRPEYLSSSPPAVLAAAHTAHTGIIPRSGKLTVIALGSAKKSASFSIGSTILGVPMIERDAGHYIGEYFPLPTDSFENEKVIVELRDEFGRATPQILGRTAVTLR